MTFLEAWMQRGDSQQPTIKERRISSTNYPYFPGEFLYGRKRQGEKDIATLKQQPKE